MDILATLAAEHREIRELIRRLADADGERASLFARLREALLRHAAGEERTFYPALRELVGKGVDEVALDHRAMEQQVARLGALAMEQGRWRKMLRLLAESFDAHVDFEERDLFERARRLLSDERRAELDLAHRAARER